jgi:hypothetical protein
MSQEKVDQFRLVLQANPRNIIQGSHVKQCHGLMGVKELKCTFVPMHVIRKWGVFQEVRGDSYRLDVVACFHKTLP